MKMIGITVLALLLSACAFPGAQRREQAVNQRTQEAQRSLQEVGRPDLGPVRVSEASYIPLRKITSREVSASQRQILSQEMVINRQFAGLGELAAWLTGLIHLPVQIQRELLLQEQGQAATSPAAGAAAAVGVSSPATGSQKATAAEKAVSFTHAGTVSSFLDVVAAKYGGSWRLSEGAVQFFLTESRAFRVMTLPGDTQLSSVVGGASGGSSGGSGGSGSATSSGSSGGGNTMGVSVSNLSVWTGLESSLRQLLTPGLGKLSTSPSTGTVTVTDTPSSLERIARLIEEQNVAMTRQVAIHVRVLSVTLNDGDDYGVNWQAVYNNLGRNSGLSVRSAFPASEGATAFTLGTSSQAANSWGANSGAIISALSTQGKVSELTSATMVTLNNQPSPVQVGRQISYIASTSTTFTAAVGATTTLTPGQIQTGFSMVVLPHIISQREILLQSSINISSLLGIKTTSTSTSTIQSPDVATSNFIQRVRMQPGDTLVLAGFDQDNLSAVSSGVGSPKNALMGSSVSSGKRSMLVILVQPLVAS